METRTVKPSVTRIDFRSPDFCRFCFSKCQILFTYYVFVSKSVLTPCKTLLSQIIDFRSVKYDFELICYWIEIEGESKLYRHKRTVVSRLS